MWNNFKRSFILYLMKSLNFLNIARSKKPTIEYEKPINDDKIINVLCSGYSSTYIKTAINTTTIPNTTPFQISFCFSFSSLFFLINFTDL